MKLILIAIGMLALAFAGIAIKIWAKKGGEFAGTCASQSPFLNKEGEACSLCGAKPEEQCKNDK
ncbi:membrane or secreted protein [Luteibaculum oceani]|uniref:Membrane or secreted protein n=1 Tax=Luteibaculum oceani TaxID=1294296 RepID=A0A5C6UZ94_9FLAO|nr:membrane or secreted protein [Luteibaculum oceani]TXC78587.1 membrane or secreted protein [Luteibaculum oceani]